MNTRGFLKLAPVVLATGFLAACGSSGGGSGSGVNSADGSKEGVAGPLDALQNPLSEQVIAPIAGAAAGTPLEPVLGCVDEAVVVDLIDVVDSIAAAAEQSASGDPAAAFEAAAANIQASLLGFAGNMQTLLTSLAGGPGCKEGGDNGADDGSDGGDSAGPFPTTGTPLDLILGGINGAIPGGGSGGGPGEAPEDVDLTDIGAFVSALAGGFNSGYDAFVQQVPAEAVNAPVVGGVLALLHDAVNDLDATVAEVTAYQGQASADQAENLLNNLLNNLLLGVIPVTAFEGATGQEGVVSDQIAGGIDQLTGALGEGLGMLLTPVLEQGLDDAASVVLDPVENQIIHTIFGPISDAVGGGSDDGGAGDGGSGDGGASTGPTGTPLDVVFNTVTGLLLGGGSGTGPTSTPLDIILTPLINGAQGGDPAAAVLGVVNGLLTGLSPLLGTVAYEASSGSLSPVLSPVAGGLLPVVVAVGDLGADDALFGNEIFVTVVDQVLAIVVGQL